MTRWALPAVIAIGLLLAAGAASAGDAGYPTGEPSEHGRAELSDTLAALGAHGGWATFLEAVALRESRFDGGAENLSRGEAAAAKRAYNYSIQKGRLQDSPYGPSSYTWGSGGWYGMFPAYGMAAWEGTDLAGIDPRAALHDPVASTIQAFEYARRIMRWAAFNGTWLSLRVGWANPSKMGDEEFVAEVAERFGSDLRAIGAPESFMHRHVDSMAGYPGAVELYYVAKGDV